MPWIGWGVAVALALASGFAGGNISGRDSERSLIASECRQAGAFTSKRTGFRCEVMR